MEKNQFTPHVDDKFIRFYVGGDRGNFLRSNEDGRALHLSNMDMVLAIGFLVDAALEPENKTLDLIPSTMMGVTLSDERLEMHAIGLIVEEKPAAADSFYSTFVEDDFGSYKSIGVPFCMLLKGLEEHWVKCKKLPALNFHLPIQWRKEFLEKWNALTELLRPQIKAAA